MMVSAVSSWAYTLFLYGVNFHFCAQCLLSVWCLPKRGPSVEFSQTVFNCQKKKSLPKFYGICQTQVHFWSAQVIWVFHIQIQISFSPSFSLSVSSQKAFFFLQYFKIGNIHFSNSIISPFEHFTKIICCKFHCYPHKLLIYTNIYLSKD